MSTAFQHGVRQTFNKAGWTRTPTISTTVIGVVVTADDADTEMFPLNQCVLVTNFDQAIAKAGKKGTLRSTLLNISKEAITPTVVVRVDEGEDLESTIPNVMGKVTDDGKRTGLELLELAKAQTGMQPKIFICPQYDVVEVVRLKLAALAEKFLGFTYCSIEDQATIQDALKLADKVVSDNLMIIYNNPIAYDQDLEAEAEQYVSAQVAGLRAKLDVEVGWHRSISNNFLSQATGTTKEVTFSPINPAGTEANTLNEKKISVLVRDDGGIKVWGNHSCHASDSSHIFEVYTRTMNFLGEEAAQMLKDTVQDKPMTRTLLEEFSMRYNNRLEEHKRAGRIIGGYVDLHPDKNGTNDLMEGRPDWLLKVTPVPPAQSPGIELVLTDEFIKQLV